MPDLPEPAPLPCIALAGPTASGKTAAALLVARALASTRPVEIISVDSALVFRGMDIGTAKPSAAELAEVPHHLINLIEPTEAYSAARFVQDAREKVAEVHQRGHLPLLVGGTMLYFKALFDGLDPMPAADPQLRAELDAEAAAVGWPVMHQRLALVDPVSAARLAPGDSQRIQRALEVYRLSGLPLSSFHGAGRGAPVAPPPLIALEPGDRAWLHQRIALRFQQMLDQGLVDEVRQLRARGDLHPELPSMRCVGYRQAWEALDQGGDLGGDHRLDQTALALLTERGIAATRQLAKRQITWLRSMPWRQTVACEAPDAAAQVLERVQQALASHPNLAAAGGGAHHA